MTRKPGILCFEVEVNGKRYCIASAGESGVLHAIVSWVGGSPKSPRKGGETRVGITDLHVGSLHSPDPRTDVHSHWGRKHLRVGDKVTIRVVRGATPDPPRGRTVKTPASLREEQRRYYLSLKRKFERKRS